MDHQHPTYQRNVQGQICRFATKPGMFLCGWQTIFMTRPRCLGPVSAKVSSTVDSKDSPDLQFRSARTQISGHTSGLSRLDCDRAVTSREASRLGSEVGESSKAPGLGLGPECRC